MRGRCRVLFGLMWVSFFLLHAGNLYALEISNLLNGLSNPPLQWEEPVKDFKNALYNADRDQPRLEIIPAAASEEIEQRKRLFNLRLGRLYILPAVQEQLYYDDNVFLHPTDQRADFVALSQPSLELQLPYKAFQLTAGYLGAFYNYSRHEGLNHLDHTPYFNLKLFLGKKFELELKERFFYTTASRDYDENLELLELRPYVQNQSEALLRYKLAERILLEASYKHRFLIFQKGEFALDNWQEDLATLTFYYALFPKTALLAEYTFGRIDYTHGRRDDSRYHIFMVGLKGKPTGKMTLEAKLGYQWRNYDFSAGEENREGRKNFSGPNFFLRLEERFTDSTLLEIYGDGRVNESYYGNNNYYVSYGGGVKFTQRFFHRLFVSLHGYWQLNDYPKRTLDEATGKEKKRMDQNWGAEAAVNFQVKDWLKLGLKYLHRGRESSHDNFDYIDNQWSFNLKIDF